MKRIVQLHFKSLFLALGIFGIASLQGCKEEEEKYVSRSYIHMPDELNAFNNRPIADADVFLYASEKDYLTNTNVIHQGKSDSEGVFELIESVRRKYWIRVVKDTLNNLRFKNCPVITTGANYYYEQTSSGTNWPARIYLSTTPAKLQTNLLQDGIPVKNASMSIYMNESDFNNYIDIKERRDLSIIYDVYGMNGNGIFDLRYTDDEGRFLLNDLEAKEYWFRFKVDGSYVKTNTNKTPKLSSDPNVTTVLDVAVMD